MRKDVVVDASAAERSRLDAVVGNRRAILPTKSSPLSGVGIKR
jgi:hypothetical protein